MRVALKASLIGALLKRTLSSNDRVLGETGAKACADDAARHDHDPREVKWNNLRSNR
jgi:hypothetical protein